MSSDTVYEFSSGPACLPDEVLKEAQQNLLNYAGTGRSVMELSHRSKEIRDLIDDTEARLRALMSIPDTHVVLFCPGGATMQFAGVPLNLLGEKKAADFIVTGTWSGKALSETEKYCEGRMVVDTKAVTGAYASIVDDDAQWHYTTDGSSAYVLYCANETVHGVQFHRVPQPPANSTLVCDMSSEFLSRPVDFSKYGLVYACTQKNFGIAGITCVIVREDLIGHARGDTPVLLDYAALHKAKSAINTPPVFAIYMTNLMLRWVERNGGVDAMQAASVEKSTLLYEFIERSAVFEPIVADPAHRSRLNVVFRVALSVTGGDEHRRVDLEKQFVKEAAAAGLRTLSGHRSVGGLRASLYNSMPLEGVKRLLAFMTEFEKSNAPK